MTCSKHKLCTSPWSKSDADTVNTLVPAGWFSEIWTSYWLSSNQGASSLTSITWTHSSWLDECWGIPWSSAIIVRLKMSCSSWSRGLKIDREPIWRWTKSQTRHEMSLVGLLLLQLVSESAEDKNCCMLSKAVKLTTFMDSVSSGYLKSKCEKLPCESQIKANLLHTHGLPYLTATTTTAVTAQMVWPQFTRFSTGECRSHRERSSKHTL